MPLPEITPTDLLSGGLGVKVNQIRNAVITGISLDLTSGVELVFKPENAPAIRIDLAQVFDPRGTKQAVSVPDASATTAGITRLSADTDVDPDNPPANPSEHVALTVFHFLYYLQAAGYLRASILQPQAGQVLGWKIVGQQLVLANIDAATGQGGTAPALNFMPMPGGFGGLNYLEDFPQPPSGSEMKLVPWRVAYEIANSAFTRIDDIAGSLGNKQDKGTGLTALTATIVNSGYTTYCPVLTMPPSSGATYDDSVLLFSLSNWGSQQKKTYQVSCSAREGFRAEVICWGDDSIGGSLQSYRNADGSTTLYIVSPPGFQEISFLPLIVHQTTPVTTLVFSIANQTPTGTLVYDSLVTRPTLIVSDSGLTARPLPINTAPANILSQSATGILQRTALSDLAAALKPLLGVTTTPTDPTVSALAIAVDTYDPLTGLLTIRQTGGGSDTVEYKINGLRDWATANQFTIPDYQRDGHTVFTILGRGGFGTPRARTAQVDFTPYVASSNWPGLVVISEDVNSHGVTLETEGLNAPQGITGSVTRADGVIEAGTSYDEAWRSGTPRNLLASNDPLYKKAIFFLPGAGGSGLTPGYNYTYALTNIQTGAVKYYQKPFPVGGNSNREPLVEVSSAGQPTTPTTPSGTKLEEGPADASLAGTDVGGRAITTLTAPALTVDQNDYVFTPQNARGTSLYGRFPPFTLPGRVVLGIGMPRYKDTQWNLQHTRGPVYISRDQGARVPGSSAAESYFFWGALWTNAAHTALNTALPLNVRREAAAYAGFDGFTPFTQTSDYQAHYGEVSSAVSANHTLPILPATGYAIGQDAYSEWKGQTAINNFSSQFNIIDSEIYTVPAGNDFATLTCRLIGQIQKALRDTYAADTDGTKPAFSPKFAGYGMDVVDAGFSYASDPDSSGNPAFYARSRAGFADTDLMHSYQGGFVSLDTYLHGQWAEEVDFFQRNTDNTVKMDSNGHPVYNRTAHSYVQSGFIVNVHESEGEHLLHELYGHDGKLLKLLYDLNGGNYPDRSDARSALCAGVEVALWERHTREPGPYINNLLNATIAGNNKPHQRWALEGQTMIKLFMAKGFVPWSKQFDNTSAGLPPNPGEQNWVDNTNGATDEGTDGSREFFLKGMYRMSLFGAFLASAGKWCIFHHPYISQNLTAGNRFTDKPRIWGKLALNNGVMSLGVIAQWPSLAKGERKTITLWLNDGTTTSPSYPISLTGRDPGLLLVALPVALANASGKDVYAAWTDQTNTSRIRRGDLRETVPAGTTPPGGATTALFSVSGVYARTSHLLTLSGENAAGPITYNMAGVTSGYELQPTGGFLVPASLRDGTRTLTILAKTGTQTAQTSVSIPADSVSSPSGTAPVLPRIGIGLFNGTVEPRYENRTAYESFGLDYVPNNDGITVAGKPAGTHWIPPYLTQLHQAGAAAGASDKLGGYTTMLYSDFKVGANLNAAWQAGNLSAAHDRLMANQFGYAKANNMSLGLALNPGRESGFREFISDNDRPRAHDQSLSAFDVISPAPRMFARLKAGFDVSNINTATIAGQYLADLKLKLNGMKPYFADGSLSFIMPGVHDNFEFAYPNFQSNPDTTWTDFHPDEIADLQAYLKGLYGNNLAALNQAWTTSYGQWSDVGLNFTGGRNDFKGRRGIDCQKFRHIRLGDCAELFARVIWSELPGIVIVIQFGQPFGGQSGIVSTMDLVYFFQRVQAVASELGITTPCVAGKCNPIAYENYHVRARFMAYALQQALGYVLTMQETSYEAGSTDIDAVNVSNKMVDYLRYGNTGRPNDAVSSFVVLFNGQKWAGKNSDGSDNDPGNSVLSMFARLFTVGNRNTAALPFNTASSAKTLTITIEQMLAGMGDGYPWFVQSTIDWTNLNGENEDVKFLTTGLGLVATGSPAGGDCVPVTGGSLGSDLTLQQNSEFVFALDGLAGSTPSMVFTWVATNGAILIEGGGTHDFAARYRFPGVGESVVSCQVTNCGGTLTRSVKATVPAAPVDGSLQPSFDVSVVMPYPNNGSLTQAVITLFNLRNATRYKIFEGEVTDNNAATAPAIPPGGGFFLPAPPAGVAKKYTVRVWNGADNSKWADKAFTVTSPATDAVQQIRRIQTKRTPGQVNNNGVQIRVETLGGYVPRFAFSKSGGFPALSSTSVQVPAFTDGTYQYGTIISDLPNTGVEYITVGYANSRNQVVNIAINDKSGTDADWVTQYDSTINH